MGKDRSPITPVTALANQGTARFVDDTGSVPGVTSANRLITAAIDAKLTELERDHNHSKAFHDPRRHLPKGRLPSQ